MINWILDNILQLSAALIAATVTVYALISRISRAEFRIEALERSLAKLETDVNEKLTDIRAQLNIITADIKDLIGRK